MHLVAEHVGGGFGAKQNLTPETIAAIELARAAGRCRSPSIAGGDQRRGPSPERRDREARAARQRLGARAVQMRAYGNAGASAGSAIAIFCRMVYPASAKDLQDFDVVNHMPPGLPSEGRGAGGVLGARAGG